MTRQASIGEGATIFERVLHDTWAGVRVLMPGVDPSMRTTFDMFSRMSACFEAALTEGARADDATVGGPIQNVVISRHGYATFGIGRHGEDGWQQLHPRDGELRFQYRSEIPPKRTPTAPPISPDGRISDAS